MEEEETIQPTPLLMSYGPLGTEGKLKNQEGTLSTNIYLTGKQKEENA